MDLNLTKYRLAHPEKVDSPALLVYPAIAAENIQKALAVVGDVRRLRPHVKTSKSVEACQLLMSFGIQQFKCATIAEAEMLVAAGAKDILLTYQPVGPKQKRWTTLVADFPEVNFSCLVDCDDVADQLSRLGVELGKPLAVYVDINAETNRTGIVANEILVSKYRTWAKLGGIELRGLHVYDGHLRQLDWNERKEACDRGFLPVQKCADTLRSLGFNVEVIAGGSTTFQIHAGRPGVVCSPGTFIYWDLGYSLTLPEQPFEPAALVFTRIISFPAEDLICLDLGHKSIAAENPLANRVGLLGVEDWIPVSQSEEHLVFRVKPGHSFRIGDHFYGIPFHICPTVALYERAEVVKDRVITGVWHTVSRDKKITY